MVLVPRQDRAASCTATLFLLCQRPEEDSGVEMMPAVP